MDLSRSAKRLIWILIFAIAVIFVSKSLLSKAAKNLSIAVEKKQQAKASKNTVILPASTPEDSVADQAAISGDETLPASSALPDENTVNSQ